MSLFRAGTAAVVIAITLGSLSACSAADLEAMSVERSAAATFGGQPGVDDVQADCPWGEADVAWDCSALVILDPEITSDDLSKLISYATLHRIDDDLSFAFDNGSKEGLRLRIGGNWLLDRLTGADGLATMFLDLSSLEGITELRMVARTDPTADARFVDSTPEEIMTAAGEVAGWSSQPTVSLYSDDFTIDVSDGEYPAQEAEVYTSVARQYDVTGGIVRRDFVEVVAADGVPLAEPRAAADSSADDSITFVDVRYFDDQGYRFNSPDDAASMDAVADIAAELPGVRYASGYESGDGITSVNVGLDSAADAVAVGTVMQKLPEYSDIDEVCFMTDADQLCGSSGALPPTQAFRDLAALDIFDEQFIDSWDDESEFDLDSSVVVDPYDLGEWLAKTSLVELTGADVSITTKGYEARFIVADSISVDSPFAAEIEAGWTAVRG